MTPGRVLWDNDVSLLSVIIRGLICRTIRSVSAGKTSTSGRRRAPLIPTHVRELVRDHGLEVIIQPSTIRVFPDADYALEGARVQEDISPCRIVFAIKEIPIANLAKHKIYVFFSHTAKGQSQNMPMLKQMMELGCSHHRL